MDIGKIIFDEFNEWVYNDENQAGVKMEVIDASDLPEIITELVKKLTIPFVGVPKGTLCGDLHSTDWNGKCFKCGKQVFVRGKK